MSQWLGPTLFHGQSDRRRAPLPDCVLSHSRFAFRKCANTRTRLDLARIGKFQSIPRNGMDARTVPELSAKRNRFWRLPLSGCITDWERCKHRSRLRILSEPDDR